jgi:hypothetical protein
MSSNVDNICSPHILTIFWMVLIIICMWAQNMDVFLRGRKLWRYVSGDIATPTKLEG